MSTIIRKPEKIIDPSFPLFRERDDSVSIDFPDTDLDEEELQKEEEILRCFLCQRKVTSPDQAISVNGRHEHTFFNPAGIVFEIRCFRLAPGCFVRGAPTIEFTWFGGFTWQYSHCSNCKTHLGWFFSSSFESFHGLIRSNLI